MSCQKQTVKERPIIFSSESVRAILDGRKTQTRRVIKPQPILVDNGRTWDWPKIVKRVGGHDVSAASWAANLQHPDLGDDCFFRRGQILWVRETWASSGLLDYVKPRNLVAGFPCQFRAGGSSIDDRDDLVNPGKWRPSIHMPRWASRITLEVIDVRVERVQDISEEDILAEGVRIPVSEDRKPLICVSGEYAAANYLPGKIREAKSKDIIRAYFASFWDSLNAKRGHSWESNPWVWVPEFKRAQEAEGDDN